MVVLMDSLSYFLKKKNKILLDTVAIDTSFGKRILIMKVKTKAIMKIISRYFDFNDFHFMIFH